MSTAIAEYDVQSKRSRIDSSMCSDLKAFKNNSIPSEGNYRAESTIYVSSMYDVSEKTLRNIDKPERSDCQSLLVPR